jgi:hypothetical protein
MRIPSIYALDISDEISGCTDPSACNYDETANVDDGLCWSANDGCSCADGVGSETDCAGVCNGSSVLDECGVCGGPGGIEGCHCDDIPAGDCDCEGNVDLGCGCGETGPSGCDQACGSTLENDECDECGGDNYNCTDYTSACSCAGCTDPQADNYDENAIIDNDTCIYLAIYHSEIPEDYYLSTYPNPFNPITSILFSIPQMGLVSIKAYDIMGRELETLSNRNLNPGNYSVDWDASGYPSGIYFVKMQAGKFLKTQKLMLVK